MSRSQRLRGLVATVLMAAGIATAWGQQAATPPATTQKKINLDIPSQPVAGALTALGQQSGLTIMLAAAANSEAISPAVVGDYTPDEALRTILASSERLNAVYLDSKTVVIREAQADVRENSTAQPVSPRQNTNGPNQAAGPSHRTSDATQLGDAKGIAEVLVTGSRILNMDIERTQDDVQPYVVLDRRLIESSGAQDIGDLLRSRVAMNYEPLSNDQTSTMQGNASRINLRGLGENQTLILIDGRRAGSYNILGTANQPDLNAIPLGAIERIEILPATASGIYGGSATGGVINIVLRRDYEGIETNLQYGNTFSNDDPDTRVAINGGFHSSDGNTSIMAYGSFSRSGGLLAGERSYVQERRDLVFQMNPALLASTVPPLGSTTNVRSLVGNLILKSGTPLNSNFAFVPIGYAGASTDGGAAFASSAGQYNLRLASTAQPAGGGGTSLLNAPTVRSGDITLRHRFSDSLEAFADVAASSDASRFHENQTTGSFVIPFLAQNNPFKETLLATVPTVGADGVVRSNLEDRKGVLGVIWHLGHQWGAEADYSFDRTTFSNSSPNSGLVGASVAVSGGAINVLQDSSPVNFSAYVLPPVQIPEVRSTLQDATIRLAGPVFELPGGSAKVTMLVEHRKQDFGDFEQITPTSLTNNTIVQFPGRSQSVDSAYLEANLPVISARNQITFLDSLEVQIAGRYDRYRTHGSNELVSGGQSQEEVAENEFGSFDPTLGLKVSPFPDLGFRGSYSKGFLPPGVEQLVPGLPDVLPASLAAQIGLYDPRRGGEPLGDVALTSGGNPNLKPERSKSTSIGLILTPRFAPGFRVSADWVRIEKTNNITSVLIGQNAINNEAGFSGIITRGAVQPGDPYGVGPIVSFNGGLLNGARATIEAIDFEARLSYSMQKAGTLTMSAIGTRQIQNSQQIFTSVAPLDLISQLGSPRWSANATLTWDFHSLSTSWTTRYLDWFWVNQDHSFSVSQGSATVPSTVYHDVFVDYRIPASSAAKLLDIQMGVRNVLNTKPRFYGLYQTYADPLSDPRGPTYFLVLRVGI